MTKRIILHAGAPKTGTTSLQAGLGRLQQDLHDQGILYPRRLFRTNDVHPLHFLLRDLKIRTNKNAVIKNGRKMLDDIFKDYDTLILSNESVIGDKNGLEPLTHLFDDCESACQNIARLFEGYEVTVFYTTRRWSKWLPSYYFQMVRQGEMRSLPSFIADFSPTALDWRLPVKALINQFGSEACEIMQHDALKNDPNSLLRAILSAAGAKIPHLPATVSMNKTIGSWGIAYMRFWNWALQIKKRSKKTRKFIRHKIYPWLTGWLSFSPKLKCPKSLAERLDASYKDQVSDIKKMLGKSGDGVS